MSRLLIADDDADLRETLTLVFERAGFEVEAVGDGEHAIVAHAPHPADVLVTELLECVRA